MNRNPILRLAILAAMLVPFGATLAAGDAEQDWQGVLALDAGPQEQPKNPAEASQMVLGHLARQEKALRGFMASYPQDARNFEARLRLARLLQIRADFEHSDKLRIESLRMLDELEKTATAEQRPELEFAKLARTMRSLTPADTVQRDNLLKAARDFQAAYPADRRLGALYAEIATLYDSKPRTKEAILEDAQAFAKDDDLKNRIADDLKRVRMFGKDVPLQLTTLQGQELKSEDLLGKPVFVIFFANFSPPSLAAVTRLQAELSQLPKGGVRVVGVCLDERREVVEQVIQARKITWPVAHDGKSWEGTTVRSLGINALPTVWLLDAKGHLRSLSALDGAAGLARQLMQER